MIVAEPAEAGPGRSPALEHVSGVPGLTVGWVVWTVSAGQLHSITEPLSWPAGRPVVARCRAERHVAPAPGCGCGVHAVSESAAADVVRRHAGEPVLVGCIAMWGRVEDGPARAPGWRAKRAYPLFVVADDHTPADERRRIGATYGVPAYRSLGELGALFGGHRLVVWWTARNRLQALLEAGPSGTPTRAAVVDVLESAVTTWAAAERWRSERPAAVDVPTPTVPDVAGIVVAWRSWRLAGGRLTSVTRADRWRGRQEMVARCDRASDHQVPGRMCTCGIYAARTIDHAARYHATGVGNSVYGCVALWGDLVEASFGWRAAKAYPLVLFAPERVGARTRRALAQTYGVPVHGVGTHGFEPSVVTAGEELRAALERGHGRLTRPGALDAFVTTTRARRGNTARPPSAPGRPPPPPLRGPPRSFPGAVAERLGLEWSLTTAVGLALITVAIVLAVVMGVHG